MKTSLALCLALLTLTACDTPQRKAFGKRLGQDAQVAATAAAAAAASETSHELQSTGKIDSTSVGTAAETAAVNALIQLDVQRAAAQAPGK